MAIKKLPSTGDAPRSTGVPASLVPGGAADSAGFPWAGRTFDHHDTAFAADDGSAPEALQEAVQRVRNAAAAYSAATDNQQAVLALADAHADALQALAGSRVLVPLLAEAGDIGMTPEGRTVEKTQELSIVTVAAPDGRRVMPVFTSVETMRRWDPQARPIPVPAPQVAIAVAEELTDLIIVDGNTPECEFGVRRTQLQDVALGQRSRPPWADDDVLAAFTEVAQHEPRIELIRLLPADPEARLVTPETEVQLTLRPGLSRDDLDDIVSAARQSWAANEVIAARVDSLRLRLIG